jgi:nitrite reductase/ring-hydroxylating ferredoxin subunit
MASASLSHAQRRAPAWRRPAGVQGYAASELDYSGEFHDGGGGTDAGDLPSATPPGGGEADADGPEPSARLFGAGGPAAAEAGAAVDAGGRGVSGPGDAAEFAGENAEHRELLFFGTGVRLDELEDALPPDSPAAAQPTGGRGELPRVRSHAWDRTLPHAPPAARAPASTPPRREARAQGPVERPAAADGGRSRAVDSPWRARRRAHAGDRRGRLTHGGRAVTVNGAEIALFRRGARVFAIERLCSHAGGDLASGRVVDIEDAAGNSKFALSGPTSETGGSLCVSCPRHNFCFSLETGEIVRPAGKPFRQKVFPVRIGPEGEVSVGFSEYNESQFCLEF